MMRLLRPLVLLILIVSAGDQLLSQDSESRTGTVTVTVADDFVRGEARWRYRLGDETLVWRGVEAPQTLSYGDTITVRGQRMRAGVFAVDALDVPRAPLVLTTAVGEQRLMLVIVQFADQALPPSRTAVASTLASTVAKLSAWSQERAWWTTRVVGPYQIPVPSSSACSYWTITSAANRAAQAAGIDLTSYPRRGYLWLGGAACGWVGLSTVGGSASQTWLRRTTWTLMAHEFGHALGLRHAKTHECGAVITDCAASTNYEYGDPYDVMGHGNAQYSGAMREILGWAEPVDGTAGGTWTLGGPDGVAVLRLRRSDGAWYYLTHLGSALVPGVSIRQKAEGIRETWLLDLTPRLGYGNKESEWLDGHLRPGHVAWLAPSTEVAVTVVEATTTAAVVRVDRRVRP